jgi:aerobic carbon-monoxide dehydrogenase medium subunit
MTSAGYAAPTSLSDAVALLSSNPSARVLAGGNGLLVGPSRAQIASSLLVDLRKVPGLSSIAAAGGGLRIGAMTTLRALASSDAVRRNYPSLAEAVLLTGDSQARNRGTVGGSLAASSGDTDLAALLIALGASVEITGPAGARTAPVEAVLASPLGRGEVITAVTLPAAATNSAVAYETQRHPATLTPLVGVAACVSLAANGTIDSVRIGLVGATAQGARLANVEQGLQGKAATPAAVKAAAAAAGQGLTVRGDLFGSAQYRSHLVRVLTARAVTNAAKALAG